VEEEDDALNEDWISLSAEDVNFSSYISVDNEHCISNTMSCPVVRQQEQWKRQDWDQHELEPMLSIT